MQYYYITTTQGNTVLGCKSNGVTAIPMTAGDSIANMDEFKATHEEFATLQRQQHTHDLAFDRATQRVTAHPRPTKKVTNDQPKPIIPSKS